jgi:hypothetical protein
VRGPDLRVRDLGDHGVLEPHDEAEQHHRRRDEHGVHLAQARPDEAEQEEQGCLEQQRKRIRAAQAAAARRVDQDGRGRGADDERSQRARPRRDNRSVAKDDCVGHGRHDAGHVGRVLLHRKEAAGVGRAGDEREPYSEVRIIARRADGCGEPTRIVDWHTMEASRPMPVSSTAAQRCS